jgi:hypothetical protein
MNSTYYINQLDKLLPNIFCKYYLGYVLYFINKLKDRLEVSSKEIARTSNGLFNTKTIGDVLKCFSIARRRTTRDGVGVKLYNISDIRNICTESYIVPINLEELNVAISGKKAAISPIIVQIPPIIDSFGEIHDNVTEQNTIPFDERFVNPFKNYSDTKVKALDSKLSYDFSLSYKFYSSIHRMLIPFYSDRWEELGVCFCIPKGYQRDSDGYPIINSRYMKELGLAGEDIRALPSPRAHRTIAIVHQPMLDWKPHEAHHECRIRDCCNPNHSEPGLRNLHQTLHNYIGDDHPLNQEIQPDNINKTPKQKAPTYWYDMINPTKNISYHQDMNIEWEGMNNYHKNRVLNTIKQTKH